jgi:PAS domain S-box-containing protein
VDALVANVLALLAGSLRAGATGVSHESAGQWRVEHLHDRMGMGISEGNNDDFSSAFGTSATPTELDTLIVEDVRQDARFSSLAGAMAGISSFAAVPLNDATGRLAGTLFAAYPHVRTVNSDEINLLHMSGTIITQFWELAAMRPGRGGLLQSPANSKDHEHGIAGSLDQAIWQLAASGATVLVNERMADLLGLTVDELAKTSLLDHLDEDGLRRAREHVELVRLGTNVRFDTWLRRKDGAPIMVSIAMTPLFVAEGQYAGALCIIAPSGASEGSA